MGKTTKREDGPTVITPRPVRAKKTRASAGPAVTPNASEAERVRLAEFLERLEPRIAKLREDISTGRHHPEVASRALKDAGELLVELAEVAPKDARLFGDVGARFLRMSDLVNRAILGRL